MRALTRALEIKLAGKGLKLRCQSLKMHTSGTEKLHVGGVKSVLESDATVLVARLVSVSHSRCMYGRMKGVVKFNVTVLLA